MELNKEIALQIERIENLRKEVFERKATAKDVERPEAMRKERAENIRGAIRNLEKRKEDLIARVDGEIKALEAELKSLESQPKVDLRGVRDGTGNDRTIKTPDREKEVIVKRKTGNTTTKKK